MKNNHVLNGSKISNNYWKALSSKALELVSQTIAIATLVVSRDARLVLLQ